MIRNVNARTFRCDPRTIIPSSIENLFGALTDGESAGWTRARDRGHAELRIVKSWIQKKNERCRVQPATRADIDVGVTGAKNRFARVLQRCVDHASKSWRRTE